MTSPRRKFLSLSVAIGVLTLAWLPSAAAHAADSDSSVQEQLDRYRVATGAIGAMATIRDGESVTSYGSGSGQLFPPTGIDADTRFRAGSQTKMAVAAIILQLVDEGKVRLDDPIELRLPGVVHGPGLDPNAITIRQLLQHRTGIKDNLGFVNGDYPQTAALLLNPVWQVIPPTPQQMVDEGTKYGKQFEPGSQGVYSNTNYIVLGMLIEELTGTDLATAIKARVIDRVGMPSTFFPHAGDKEVPSPALRGYLSVVGAPFADVTNFEPAIWGAAAALVSDGRDLTRFVNALLNGEVVSHARLADMQQTLPVSSVGDYGLGLVAVKTSCGTVWGHTGEVAGYTSLTYATGRRAISIVVNNTPVVSDGATAADATTRLINEALCQ